MRIQSVHTVVVDRPLHEVFAEIEALGTPAGRFWPAPKMPFVRTEGPMRVGVTRESHGVIRATLTDYVKDERIVWSARLSFITGTHAFHLRTEGASTRVTHELVGTIPFWFVPVWFASFSAVHDRIASRMLERLRRLDARAVPLAAAA